MFVSYHVFETVEFKERRLATQGLNAHWASHNTLQMELIFMVELRFILIPFKFWTPFKSGSHPNNIGNSARTSKKTQHVSITKINIGYCCLGKQFVYSEKLRNSG